MDKPEMAANIAEYVKKYNGKSKADIKRMVNARFRKNGVTKDSWEDENPVPQYADNVSFILDHFAGKGPDEIQIDLETFDPSKREEIHTIVERLSLIPDLED